MRTSRHFTHMLMALFAVLVMSATALAADPGLPFPATSEASDQKAGSILYYNAYTSNAANPLAADTRINITNTNSATGIAVHLFFVDAALCQPADSFICLTANQTASFLTSDVDPGISGYIVAVASDLNGLPVQFNFLIGDEYVEYASGHAANLGAVAFAKVNPGATVSTDGTLALLSFNGVDYNAAPRVVALDNIQARADANDTLLILNRVGGNLATGAATLTGGGQPNLFGILYDDAETPLSFTFAAAVCQFRSSITNSFPRTAPRVESVIPAGRSGWMKIFSLIDIGIVGAQINRNTGGSDSGAFNGGHNLHHLRLTNAATLIIPIFPPNC